MLQLSQSLLNKSVLSLRTGAPIAVIKSPIINPDNLKIEGFYCQDRFNKNLLILLSQDIREILSKGYVVNDIEVLSEPDELVRLHKVIEIDFDLIGKQVVTVSKQKVGKVSDYATETGSMYIQKIYVSQKGLRSLAGGSLSIDRSQINEITPRRIIINELIKKAPLAAPAAIA
jgi:sporulation protein YlmC with PRC-barrel domain